MESNKKILKKLSLFLLFCTFLLKISAQDSITIQGKKYRVDTITYRHNVGLETMHTYYNLPDMPLLVNILEIDYSNPFVKVETCLSNDTLKRLERPTSMARRKSYVGHKVFATVNGDFYNTQYPNVGLPINGQMLKGEIAKTPDTARGVITFDNNKNIAIGYRKFSGTLTANDKTYTVNGINRERNQNELILYNSYIGKNTKTNNYGTEVIACLMNDAWDVNKTLQLKIENIIDGKGSNVIPEGKVILSGHLEASNFLKTLSPGDEVNITLNIKNTQTAEDNHQYKEMIGGGRIILKDGTPTNNIWPHKHPRTAAGFSSDNKKLILVVVDGRTTSSRGVGTEELADILKLSGASTALNLDGGGSSVMVVRDKITNYTSDGSERNVANALQIVSTAVPQEPVAFQLNISHFKTNFGNTYKIGCSSFDENGEVVNYLDFNQVKYDVIGDIGTIDDSGMFKATGKNTKGLIVASWNEQKDTVKVTINRPALFKFSVNNLVIDDRNEYTFTVYGYDDENKRYTIENSSLNFKILDNSVGSISSTGTFTGSKNGVTKVIVTSKTLDLSDTCTVNVETGVNKILLDDFSDIASWNISKSWLSDFSISREVHPELNKEMLKIDYTLKYAYKTASISLKKNIDTYGMPDSLMLKSINSGFSASYYTVLDHPYGLSKTIKYDDASYLERYAPINTNKINQEDYRVPFKELRINLEKSSSYKEGDTYNGTFWIDKLYAVYPTKNASVGSKIYENESKLKIYPNPAHDNIHIEANLLKNKTAIVKIYNVNGKLAYNKTHTFNTLGHVSIPNIGMLSSGMHIIDITVHNSKFIKKLIIQ